MNRSDKLKEFHMVDGLYDWMIVVRFPAGAGNVFLRRRVQTKSEANLDSCTTGTEGSFPGGKAGGP
jgi:hypothetical protein